jgi:D-lactate dehydrogenase
MELHNPAEVNVPFICLQFLRIYARILLNCIARQTTSAGQRTLTITSTNGNKNTISAFFARLMHLTNCPTTPTVSRPHPKMALHAELIGSWNLKGMRTLCFSTKPYDRSSFTAANHSAGHDLTFITPGLSPETIALAAGYPAICLFVNDAADRSTLERLASGGTRFIALRCAGFNNIDLTAAMEFGMGVVRVPAYSPYATAEHAIALMLMLNRHLHRAYHRVRDGNFSLDGLLGFDMHGKSVGIIGTGRIGAVACRILIGFGCTVLASDPVINPAVLASGGRYVPLDELLTASDIVTLHAPLTPETRHLIDAPRIARLKIGMMLINTSRGALVDTLAVIDGLKSGHIGALGLDVYEEEADLFFQDLSSMVIKDDVFARLQTFPNVVITGHQAFFTCETLAAIAQITLDNLTCLESGKGCVNLVLPS